MKLAIIGNSHVGMIRAASRDAAFSEHEFLWMAKAGQGSDRFEVEGSRILTRDAGLRARLAKLGMADTLDLAQCDGAVFVGNTLSAFDLATVARSHVVGDWLSDGAARSLFAPSQRSANRPQLLSSAALADHLHAVLRAGTTYRLISGLDMPKPFPIHVVPQPMPSETVLHPKTEKHGIFRKIAPLGIFAPMADALRASHDTVFTASGLATIHHQPRDTIAHDLFTRLPFARGSVRLHTDKTHGADDVLHANADYGARILQTIFDSFS